MSTEVDRQRKEANRSAVVVFLASELGCEFESRDENGIGIRFFARGTKFGTLRVAEESLEDRERPEYLIQLLKGAGVPTLLREGKSVSVTNDDRGELSCRVVE
jgi:hypothetical protein